jgi:hypothetical protein
MHNNVAHHQYTKTTRLNSSLFYLKILNVCLKYCTTVTFRVLYTVRIKIMNRGETKLVSPLIY